MQLARLFSIVRRLRSAIPAGQRAAASRLRDQISVFFISAGVTLLTLTAGTYEWIHFAQQRLLQQMQLSAGSKTVSGRNTTDLTLLSIPKVELNTVVVEGTSRKALLFGPGHLVNTAMPGEPGNAVIAGHRDTIFRRLVELETGDEIIVTRYGVESRYVVTNKSVVSPQATEVTLPSKDTRLTLVTCFPTYYLGPAPKRLIVVARLKDSHSLGVRASVSGPSLSP